MSTARDAARAWASNEAVVVGRRGGGRERRFESGFGALLATGDLGGSV
jgi:hypothetical protein